jgi:hypothetical protein
MQYNFTTYNEIEKTVLNFEQNLLCKSFCKFEFIFKVGVEAVRFNLTFCVVCVFTVVIIEEKEKSVLSDVTGTCSITPLNILEPL